ncbi:xanthine dehydrogenase subunit XdhB [Thermophilibacter immobilis]|jgi:xanthine dehydrogenase FAD-binding subunit|uniref:Xanthine dehydrogenase FAD-binding subunit XdhB n=1 Tax=Thermophilibacter immobilis TaxID=2779519 RepID=A0A7S7RU62_9ACTN|nr:xanthine dehydrogenase subunit XdhB [Thermophilibacter immobilis]QOY60258.1 xanthine dehydrogenase FAD-binding subunit XdhB [Thermophilibacter immobilis]
MYDIEVLHEATSVDDAVSALANDPEAIPIAGGTDVLVKVRDGKMAGAHLVSIHNLHDELDGVTLADDGTVEIGPITWFHHVTTSPVVQETVPTLGDACDTPGGPQLRVSGTIGGNICNAATSGDSAPTLYAYGALLDVRSVRGTRTIPIEEWYAGPGRSFRERDELLVKIRIPRSHYEGFTGHYFKYGKRRALEIATMSCCCLVKLDDGKTTVKDVRLAFGVAGPTPMRALGAEEGVRGLPVTEAVERIGELAQADTNPRDSWRASKEFRLQLIKEMACRSLAEAARRGGADI